MEFGKSEHRVPVPKREDALRALAEENRIQDGIIGLHEWDKELQNEEHGIDTLTGVHTRKFFDAKLERELLQLGVEDHRHGGQTLTELACVFIDLDHFKAVNDTLGHARGDEVLQRAATLLRSALRESDTLGRYGGDEFVALLPNPGNEDTATKVAEKLRAVLDNDEELIAVGVTASIGVASTKEKITPDELRERADKAMYQAKKGGRNQVVISDEV
jgi:diguanylate cyclase (GGDEF)-like protein